MIGSAAGLSFNDFALNLGPLVLVVFAATLAPICLIWGRSLKSTPEHRQRVLDYQETEAITDPRLLKQSLVVLAVVITPSPCSIDTDGLPATIPANRITPSPAARITAPAGAARSTPR